MTTILNAVKQARILAVDDEAINRMLLGDILGEDYIVDHAENGRRALDLLARRQFDLVLLDIMMPGIDGFGVLEAIRNAPASAGLPVILISAVDNSKSIIRGLSLGANDYISRPFQPDVVKARINTQLALKRLLDERDNAIIELQHVHELKDQMVRTAAHDLRAPLATIRSANYLLNDSIGSGDAAEVAQLIDAIDSTVDALYGIIQNYLDVAFEPNTNVVSEANCEHIEDLLTSIVNQQVRLAKQKGITLEVAPIDLPILLPVRRMRQILGHLIRHALRYSAPDAFVQLQASEQASGVRITILCNILDSETATIAASGLGMADRLARLLGGRVGVDRPLDDRMIFWLEVPRRSLRNEGDGSDSVNPAEAVSSA